MRKHKAHQIQVAGFEEAESLSNDEKFRKAMEAAPLAMLKVDQKGTILFANQSALDLFGYEKQELLNKPVETLLPDELRHLHKQHLQNFSRKPDNRRMAKDRDLFGQHKDGSLIYLQIGLTPLNFTGDHQILVTIHDISDQKRFEEPQAQLNTEREERINESERQRCAALKLAQDAERARLRAEAAEQRLAKVASDLALFKSTQSRKTIKHRLNGFHLRNMIRCGNQIRRLSIKRRSLDGVADEIVEFFDQHFIDHDNNKAFSCIRFFRTQAFATLTQKQKTFLLKDTTDIGQDEMCLVQCGFVCKDKAEDITSDTFGIHGDLPQHFAAPLSSNNSKNPIPLLQAMLCYLGHNSRLTGKTLNQEEWMIGNKYPGYVSLISRTPAGTPADDHPSTLIGLGGVLIDEQLFLMIAQANTHISEETFMLLSHLNLSIKLSLLPLCAHEDRTIEQIKTVQTLLQRTQNLVIDQENRLRLTMEQLEYTNAELDQFAYIASHDLQAPLHGISNLADFLLEDLQDTIPEDSRNDLLMLKSRTGRMKKLLKDLLEYARVGHQHPNFEELSIKEVVNDILILFEIPRTFTVHVPEELPVIRSPRTIMDLIFRNLIGNALKHHDRESGRIEITCVKVGRMFELGVKDDGPGIDPAYHEQIFNVFNTLKPRDQVEGSGMGLAIVEKTVQHYGGTMSLDSEKGKGAHFKFTWPQKCG
jgi:PAS domain S-box-containing protein